MAKVPYENQTKLTKNKQAPTIRQEINNLSKDFSVLSSWDSGALRYRLLILLANMRIDAKVEGPQGPP